MTQTGPSKACQISFHQRFIAYPAYRNILVRATTHFKSTYRQRRITLLAKFEMMFSVLICGSSIDYLNSI
jgi:hypothetical protein